MGDEQIGQAEPVAKVGQEVEDLRLDRHVQRRDGFVADDELGFHRERARDADALALPAGELVRVAGDVLRIEPDQAEQLGDAFLLGRALGQMVRLDRLRDDRSDGHPGIERAVRVLEDDLHLATHLAQLLGLQRVQVHAVEPDRAAGRVAQPDHRAPDRALPAPGLADEAQRLAAANLDGHAVDRLDGALGGLEDAGTDREVDLEVVDLDDVGRVVWSDGRVSAHGGGQLIHPPGSVPQQRA